MRNRRIAVNIWIGITALLAVVLISCGGSEGGDHDHDTNFVDTMAREHANDVPNGNEVAWMEPAAPVEGERVVYRSANGKDVEGYYALPASAAGDSAASTLPGVIIIHEWWGLNENVEAMARRIAGDGYKVLAVDLYNGQVAQTPDQAKTYMQEVSDNPSGGVENLQQGLAWLKKQGVSRMGVIGWCFGGGWSLQTALNFPDQIDATVIYYGHLDSSPDELKKLDMPVLGFFGGKDEGIPVDHVRHFAATLDSLGVKNTIKIYDDAAHAFANPSGERYNPEAAADSWEKTAAFLAENLK